MRITRGTRVPGSSEPAVSIDEDRVPKHRSLAWICWPTLRGPRGLRSTALPGVLLVVLAATVAPVGAQSADASRIASGDSLRLKLPGHLWVDAHFESWSADVMMLGVEGVTGDWPVSIFDLTGLQLYTGRSPRQGLRHWAMLGAVGGMFAGAGVGLLIDTSGAGAGMSGPSADIISTTVRWATIGMAVGAVAGGVYGGARPGMGWIGIELPTR